MLSVPAAQNTLDTPIIYTGGMKVTGSGSVRMQDAHTCGEEELLHERCNTRKHRKKHADKKNQIREEIHKANQS